MQCAGVRGEFTMDDAYTAGRFVKELAVWLPEHDLTDAAAAAEALAGSSTPGTACRPRRARATCATPTCTTTCATAPVGLVDVVPLVVDVHDGVAMITA